MLFIRGPCLWPWYVSLWQLKPHTWRPQGWSFSSRLSWSFSTSWSSTRPSPSSSGPWLWVKLSDNLFGNINHMPPCHSFFFLPQDVCNSVFAAIYFCILSLMVLSTQRVVGALFGGVRDLWHATLCNIHSSPLELQCSIVKFWFLKSVCRSSVLWWSGYCVQTASCSSRTSHWTSRAVKPGIQI